MKTTVDIPDGELRDLVTFTRAKTKREAIVTAIADFNQRSRIGRARPTLGELPLADY